MKITTDAGTEYDIPRELVTMLRGIPSYTGAEPMKTSEQIMRKQRRKPIAAKDKQLREYNRRADYREAIEAALTRFADLETFPNQMPVDFATVLTTELGNRDLLVTRKRKSRK